MKIKKLIVFFLLTFAFTPFIHSNEFYANSVSFKFCKSTDLGKNYNYSDGNLLAKDIQLYALSGSANARTFFYVGIAGVIVHVVGLSMIIPAAVLLALDYTGKIVYAASVNRMALLISSGVLLGFGILFAVTGLVLAGVGFGLFFYYGGRLAYLFNETDYQKGVISSGFAVRI